MKKLVFMFVALAAISFASCGNGNKAAEPAQDTTSVDTASVDTTAAPADTTAADSAK